MSPLKFVYSKTRPSIDHRLHSLHHSRVSLNLKSKGIVRGFPLSPSFGCSWNLLEAQNGSASWDLTQPLKRWRAEKEASFPKPYFWYGILSIDVHCMSLFGNPLCIFLFRTRCRRSLRCISSSRCAVVNVTSWVWLCAVPVKLSRTTVVFCYNTAGDWIVLLRGPIKKLNICMKTSWTWLNFWIFGCGHPILPSKRP